MHGQVTKAPGIPDRRRSSLSHTSGKVQSICVAGSGGGSSGPAGRRNKGHDRASTRSGFSPFEVIRERRGPRPDRASRMKTAEDVVEDQAARAIGCRSVESKPITGGCGKIRGRPLVSSSAGIVAFRATSRSPRRTMPRSVEQSQQPSQRAACEQHRPVSRIQSEDSPLGQHARDHGRILALQTLTARCEPNVSDRRNSLLYKSVVVPTHDRVSRIGTTTAPATCPPITLPLPSSLADPTTAP